MVFPPCAMVGRAILTKDCAMDLSGKTVLITGASRGIGEASVAEFADAGWASGNRTGTRCVLWGGLRDRLDMRIKGDIRMKASSKARDARIGNNMRAACRSTPVAKDNAL